MIKRGASIVRTMPLKTDIIAYSLPVNLVMIGNVVSIDVAPPEAIGARFPQYLANTGVINMVVISRMILERSAITPNVSPLICAIKILDRL